MRTKGMWKPFWRKWTVDRPAALGDWLWQVLVVELAAHLDRLTWRQVIAFVPVLILLVAYAHNIPLPPEGLLVGDIAGWPFGTGGNDFICRPAGRQACNQARWLRVHDIAPSGFPSPANEWCEEPATVDRPSEKRRRRAYITFWHCLGLAICRTEISG
jgi:hypothetical protein